MLTVHYIGNSDFEKEKRKKLVLPFVFRMERITGLEPATSTLARLRSTK